MHLYVNERLGSSESDTIELNMLILWYVVMCSLNPLVRRDIHSTGRLEPTSSAQQRCVCSCDMLLLDENIHYLGSCDQQVLFPK